MAKEKQYVEQSVATQRFQNVITAICCVFIAAIIVGGIVIGVRSLYDNSLANNEKGKQRIEACKTIKDEHERRLCINLTDSINNG